MRPVLSSERRLVVVAYDIAHDDRRDVVARVLARYGERVLESVFECWLAPAQIEALRTALARVVGLGDSVRFYALCRRDWRHVAVDGASETTKDWDYRLV
ncbi:MAG: CRISPR-associated endonuclease Cas2 [Acidobacteria bacterium]|nr:CRISPR-associated endonuclease Cas2 [Acidobacteriota bacterium]